jgi:hypothetical protein
MNTGTLTGGLEAVVFNIASVQVVNTGVMGGALTGIRTALALSSLTLMNGWGRFRRMGGGVGGQAGHYGGRFRVLTRN